MTGFIRVSRCGFSVNEKAVSPRETKVLQNRENHARNSESIMVLILLGTLFAKSTPKGTKFDRVYKDFATPFCDFPKSCFPQGKLRFSSVVKCMQETVKTQCFFYCFGALAAKSTPKVSIIESVYKGLALGNFGVLKSSFP